MTAPLDLRAVEARWAVTRIPGRSEGDDTATFQFAVDACADIYALLAHARALRVALVNANVPYLALLMDRDSRKWITPGIWKALEKVAADSETVLGAARDGPA